MPREKTQEEIEEEEYWDDLAELEEDRARYEQDHWPDTIDEVEEY